jgi:hypothetical protein
MDCRPTQNRIVGNHYEVKVDGVWTPVPYDKINNVVAPDGGAHVCAPRQVGQNKGALFCILCHSAIGGLTGAWGVCQCRKAQIARQVRRSTPQEVTGKYLVVWEKVGSDWKLAADISNDGK